MDALPEGFRCALSRKILRDPVKCCDAHVYERTAIEEWFRKGHTTSPITGQELVSLSSEPFHLRPLKALKAAVAAYIKECCEDVDDRPDQGSGADEDGACPVSLSSAEALPPSALPQQQPAAAPGEDDGLQYLRDRLQTEISLAASELASDETLAAPYIMDAIEHSKRALKASGAAGEGPVFLSSGEDATPTGAADVVETGETTPMSARLAEPAGAGDLAPAPDSRVLREPGGRGRRGPSRENGLARPSRGNSVHDLRQGAPLAPSRRRLHGSRSPSPEEGGGHATPGVDRHTAGGQHRMVAAGPSRVTPRRPALDAAGASDRNGAAPRMLVNRPRPRSPAAGAGNHGAAPVGRASRLSQTTASAASAARGLRASAPSLRGRCSRGSNGTGTPGVSSSRARTGGLSTPAPPENTPSAAGSRRNSGSSAIGLGYGQARTGQVARRQRRSDEHSEGPKAAAKTEAPVPASSGQGQQARETDDAGRTPLMHAAREGNVAKTEQLLCSGFLVDATDACRCTALMYAATYGHVEVARLLVEHYANVDAHSQDRWTPLIAAAYNGHLTMAQFLLSRGADIESADERGWTSLMHVAFNGNTQTLGCLLDNHAKVDAEDSEGRSALVYAAFNGHLENVRCLLERSDKVRRPSHPGRNGRDDGPSGLALLFAANHGHVEVVRLLLEAAAPSGQTQRAAMKLAHDHGHDSVVDLLMRRWNPCPGTIIEDSTPEVG
eukprot:TRINITY_DN93154_c0_g1_i1.p1 TRINITY_DN93154_c0_g1~~TRINITY_DN93154_c0_g1_i1.p1  ORF type:complete len:736 (+),score=114.18 TRINITY_DN93154_c0_g1_i1:34-2208(+)